MSIMLVSYTTGKKKTNTMLTSGEKVLFRKEALDKYLNEKEKSSITN